MSKEKRRVPKLRFPGFTEDWEQRKADYIFKSVTDKGYPELPVLSASQELGMVYRDQNGIDIQHDKKNETSYKRVLPGQFVIHLRSFQGGFAYSEIEGITSPAYTVMSFKNSSEQYGLFWKHVFKSEIFIKRLETITYGIRDGRSISFSDFKSLLLQYPSFSEQKLIGDSIAVIERGITLHQRKLDNLKLKKKTLLQKLFPKNGERYPELRFPGFTDAWEQRKLIYIFNDFIVPMRDKPKVFSGTTPWTRIEDIEGRYINTSLSGQFVSDETIKSMNLKVIPKGSLIVSASATFGVVAIVNNDLITNQTFIGLVPNKDFDIDFLYSLFEAPTTKNKLLKLSAGSTIFYIARESFENLVLSVPSKVEQIKISKIFKSIDNSITLHQRKLDHLQLQKKALLQQMFV